MRILITGGTGYLGSFVAEELLARGHAVVALQRRPHPFSTKRDPNRYSEILFKDGEDLRQVPLALVQSAVDTIIHIAAETSGARCEAEPELAVQANVHFTEGIVALAERFGARLVYLSTDLVFDGAKAPQGGFVEQESPAPISTYARTKLQAEQLVAAASVPSTIVRTSLLLGPDLGPIENNLKWMFNRLRSRESVTLFGDEWRTPVDVRDVAYALALIAEHGSALGVVHCSGPKRVSRSELGRIYCLALGLPWSNIIESSRTTVTEGPRRPEDVSLCSDKLRGLLKLSMKSPEQVFLEQKLAD